MRCVPFKPAGEFDGYGLPPYLFVLYMLVFVYGLTGAIVFALWLDGPRALDEIRQVPCHSEHPHVGCVVDTRVAVNLAAEPDCIRWCPNWGTLVLDDGSSLRAPIGVLALPTSVTGGDPVRLRTIDGTVLDVILADGQHVVPVFTDVDAAYLALVAGLITASIAISLTEAAAAVLRRALALRDWNIVWKMDRGPRRKPASLAWNGVLAVSAVVGTLVGAVAWTVGIPLASACLIVTVPIASLWLLFRLAARLTRPPDPTPPVPDLWEHLGRRG